MINPEILSKINDPDALKALVLEWVKIAQEKEQLVQNAALKIQALTHARAAVELENQSLQSTVQFNTAYIEKLQLELANLRRIRFGSKSEALNSPQGKLFEELLDIEIGNFEQELKKLSQANTKQDAGNSPTQKKPPRQGAGRQELPAHLPRIDYLHDLPADQCQCKKCDFKLVKIGEDISEKLAVIPAQFIVHRHIRPQYACNACETIQAKPIEPEVIEGSYCTPGLAAWIMCNKYLDHLPLYRQEEISHRFGVTLSRQTMANWVGQYGHALMPLAQELQKLLLQRRVLHADETPIKQLKQKNKTIVEEARTAYIWAYCTSDIDSQGPPIILFDYQPSRQGEHAKQFLANYSGHLMVDDYKGYKKLFKENPQIIELGCMVHARRQFFEFYKSTQSPIAKTALDFFACLYHIESDAKDVSVQERTAIRKERCAPVLKLMKEWLDHQALIVKSAKLLNAIMYTLGRWEALIRYAKDGSLPIDNNPVENHIRPIAIGKKNWLFVGCPRAGQSMAAIYSLLMTAKRNGLEPYAWLKNVLERLPTQKNKDIAELLPFSTFQLTNTNEA
jgi:transposase